MRYSYLWHDEARRGRDEGIKDRPCAVVLATTREDDETVVVVVPITHTLPGEGAGAIPLPPETQKRLGLDDDPCWIVTGEVNRFIWPGPDLQPVRDGGTVRWSYGLLPRGILRQIQEEFRRVLRERPMRDVSRD